MAIKLCKECKKGVSTKAPVCPHCGAKNPTKQIGCLGIFLIGALVLILFGVLFGTHRDKSKHESTTPFPASRMESPKEDALNQIRLDFEWGKGGIAGGVMIANFTIENPSKYPVKDIEITCTHFAKSGTKIDSNTRVIYDVIPPDGKKVFKNFNMGFIHSQAEGSSCKVTDLKISD